MKLIKISKLHANSKVEWDTASGKLCGKIKNIMGTHASVIHLDSGNIYVIPICKLRKRINEL